MFSLYTHLGEKANHCLFQIQESAKTFLGKLQKESSILKEKEKSSCLLKKHFFWKLLSILLNMRIKTIKLTEN